MYRMRRFCFLLYVSMVGASCWRCGCSNHYTTECYAKTAESGESLEKAKVTSLTKRKRNDDEIEEENKKKAKIAAIRAEPEEVKQRRIWEMDTDLEEDV
jgi:hypothetical protein